jgi:hypothetical protein
VCSDPGKSQCETREKDFFFRRGGGAWRTSGKGGGGMFSVCGDGIWKAAEASLNDFRRVGM